MKTILATLAVASTLVAASSHGSVHEALHRRRNAHAHARANANLHERAPMMPEKRQGPDVSVVDSVPTVLEFEFEGGVLDEMSVCKGIANGTFAWAPGTEGAPDCGAVLAATSTTSSSTTSTTSTTSTSSTTSSKPTPTTTSAAGAAFLQTSAAVSTHSSAPSSSPAAAASPAAAIQQGGSGLNTPFPDGQISCSTFPSSYGPIALDYLNLDGWSGIQQTQMNAAGLVDYIVTGTSGGCSGDGTYCSYACPAGYQKSQWPANHQGATGQSVGGLLCQGGTLHLSNPNFNTLCIPGTGMVNIQNTLGSLVSVCSTDYPGTESETIPLVVSAGSTEPLTCPNAATYYQHEGASTSAQYYVNPAGVPGSEACQWDSAGSGMGNWAPINLGVGTDANGKTWLSMLSTVQNIPANQVASVFKPLNFGIKLVGNFLPGIECSYQNGQFCSNTGCQSNEDYVTSGVVPGCTVELMPNADGSYTPATYVFF